MAQVVSSTLTPLRFYAESFAPWCERARWALDHHGIEYREITQLPLVSELTLRIAARRRLERATVPMIVGRDDCIIGSDAIARYAESRGSGSPLFPIDREHEVAGWMETSETLMVAGRAMLLPRMATNAPALREQLPSWIPRSLRRGFTWIASLGVRHLISKYGVRADDERHDAESRRCLQRLRVALADGDYLAGSRFSYADVTMAAALQFVLPVDGWISLEPATREVWTNHRLADDYADVLAWRDRLYQRHRGSRDKSAP